MTLSKQRKQELIDKFGKHPEDTGSAQVQIAILTQKIENLTEHLREHPTDHHSRRGLLKMVGQRKRLLKYLKRESPETFQEMTDELRIRVKIEE